LGPALAERLNADAKSFGTRLKAAVNDQRCDVLEYDSGAVAVLLNAYAKDPAARGQPPHRSVIPDPWDPSIEVAAWMHREFRRRGML
jgi:hypothetical protein